MIRLIALMLSLKYAGCFFAQHTFYTQIDLDFNTHSSDVIELEDAYIYCGYSIGPSPERDNLVLVKINKTGNLLWFKELDISSRSTYRTILDNGDGFMVGGDRVVDIGAVKLISKFDYDGNLIWEKEYGKVATVGMENLVRDIVHFEGGYLVGGSVYDSLTLTADAQLLMLDADGEVLRSTIYYLDNGVEHYGDCVFKIIPTSTDIYLEMFSVRSTDWRQYKTLIKTELDGNEIWRKKMQPFYISDLKPELGYLYYRDFTLTNSNTILALFVRESLEIYQSETVFIEYNALGEEIDIHVKDFIQPIASGNVYMNELNEIFVTGNQDMDTLNDYEVFQLYLAKYSANYELEWEYNYGEKNQNEFYESSMLTNDKGFLLSGNFLDLEKALGQMLVVKTDCQGRLEWNYEACIDTDNPEINIFPNPFSTEINFHIPLVKLEDKVTIQLFTLTGQIAYSTEIFGEHVIKLSDISLASGIYIAQVFVNEEKQIAAKIICR